MTEFTFIDLDEVVDRIASAEALSQEYLVLCALLIRKLTNGQRNVTITISSKEIEDLHPSATIHAERTVDGHIEVRLSWPIEDVDGEVISVRSHPEP